MIEGYAEYYSAELAQKVKRGMRESCLKGNAAGVKPIFGYRLVNKKYVIEENEAEIVRKLFSDYTDGKIIKELVEWLKNSGVRTHRGKVFSFGRVSEMLRNPKYIGKCSYGGRIYENIVPPIIEENLFNRVQERLSENAFKSGRARAGEKFILSGKLVCAECGNLMVGESGTCRNGEIHYFYKCTNKKRNTKNCPSHAVKKEVLENSVYSAIISALKDEEFIERVAEQMVEIHNAELKESRELKILGTIFWCVFLLGMGLCCIFAISAVIKNMVSNNREVSTIVGKFFLSILGTLAMLAVVVLGILISDSLLKLVAEIFEIGNTMKLSNALFNACVGDWINGYSIAEMDISSLSVSDIFGGYNTTFKVFPTSWKCNGMVNPNTSLFLPAMIASVGLGIALLIAIVNLAKRIYA